MRIVMHNVVSSSFVVLLLLRLSSVLALSKKQLNGNLLVGAEEELFLYKKTGQLISTVAKLGAHSIDYSCKNNDLVFVNWDTAKVYVQNTDSLKALPAHPGWKPISIAIDEKTSKIYVSDNATRTVYAYSVREQVPKPVYKAGADLRLNKNWHIAIDSKKNFLFIQASSEIIRTSLDGSKAKKIYSGFHKISRITVHPSQSRLFWMDVDSAKIVSVNYDGTDEKTHYKETGDTDSYSRFDSFSIVQGMMYGFSFYEEELFVVDLQKGTKNSLEHIEDLSAHAIYAVNC